MYLIFRVITTTLVRFGSGYLTFRFLKKKDPSGRTWKKTGYPIFAAKLLAGFPVGISGGFPLFPFVRGPLVSLAVGALGVALVFRKLDNRRAAPVLLSEFIVLGLAAEAVGTYVPRLWF